MNRRVGGTIDDCGRIRLRPRPGLRAWIVAASVVALLAASAMSCAATLPAVPDSLAVPATQTLLLGTRASGVTELGGIARLAEALAASAETEEFEQAYVAYDRANRLAGKSDGAAAELDPKLATDEAELALITAVAGASPKIAAALEAREFDDALAAAAELRAPVDRFFDEVLVMADDAQVRANRLRLLLDVRDAVGALGDLAQIPR